MDLHTLIRDIADYPKPGIVFKDISPLLKNPSGLAMAVEQMANPYRGKGVELVCGAESRGFIFGTAIAQIETSFAREGVVFAAILSQFLAEASLYVIIDQGCSQLDFRGDYACDTAFDVFIE